MTLEGKLHLAPIGANPQRVLDVGTGTGKDLLSLHVSYTASADEMHDLGIWAIDFAE
jgi:ubiquinone/menaquinone biosynthesis C-methylase UbiE